MYYNYPFREELVPITAAWHVLRLRVEERPPIWRVAANVLIGSREQATRGGPLALRLGEVLTNPRPNNLRGGADKSLARPERKQATATKFGIYSTYHEAQYIS